MRDSSYQMPNLKDFFGGDKEDKLLIEITYKGDADKVHAALMKAMHLNTEVFDGAVISQIFFKGKEFKDIIEKQKKDAIDKLKSAIYVIDQLQ